MSDETILSEILAELREAGAFNAETLVSRLKGEGLTHERAIAALKSEMTRRRAAVEELHTLEAVQSPDDATLARMAELAGDASLDDPVF